MFEIYFKELQSTKETSTGDCLQSRKKNKESGTQKSASLKLTTKRLSRKRAQGSGRRIRDPQGSYSDRKI